MFKGKNANRLFPFPIPLIINILMGQTKLGKCVIKTLMCDNFSAFHIITHEQKKMVSRSELHKFSFAFYLHNSNFITSGNYCYSQRTTKLTSSKNKQEQPH